MPFRAVSSVRAGYAALVPEPDAPELSASRAAKAVQWVGYFAGPLLALIVYLSLGQAPGSGGEAPLGEPGRRVLAVAAWMAAWWMTEAVPVSITAVLPLVLLPLLGARTMSETAAPYANEVIFLFVGGFILGEALQSSGLHRRIAINTLLAVGTSPSRIVAGVMLVTAVLSMWVSNTATTIMMLPIGLSLVHLVERCAATDEGRRGGWNAGAVRHLGISVVLGIAYAASIGGMGTPIGSPPNVIMLSFARTQLGREIDFFDWMKIGVPLVAVFLPLSWLFLTRVLHPVRAGRIAGGRELLRSELAAHGPMKRAEWATFGVFLLAAGSWVFRPYLARTLGLEMLTDAGIAMTAALLLFLIPIDVRSRRFVVSFESVQRLPWGILLLFGGGLSLAAAMSATSVDTFLGGKFESLAGLSFGLVLLVLIGAIVFGGELASNTAVVTALMPVLIAAAPRMNMDPLALMFGVTLAASVGFMLPVATPPNALAFATGRVSQPQMIRAGVVLDLLGIALITLLIYFAGDALIRSTS